jgi:hypothetical protein
MFDTIFSTTGTVVTNYCSKQSTLVLLLDWVPLVLKVLLLVVGY